MFLASLLLVATAGQVIEVYTTPRGARDLEWHLDGERLFISGGPEGRPYVNGVLLGSPAADAEPDPTTTDADSSGSETVTPNASTQSPFVLPDEVLIYVRARDTGEYVRLLADSTQILALPTDGYCTTLSSEGVYTATTSLQGDDLIIRRLDTQEIMVQVPWDEAWEPCNLMWVTESILGIQTGAGEWVNYDVSGGSLTPVIYQPTLPQYPPLPDRMPSIEESFILPSPDENIYLYQRCPGQLTNSSGTQCMANDEFVIYDVAQQTDLHILDNPDTMRILGYDFILRRPVSAGSAAWSATGRYLAFEHRPGTNLFTLSVYDLQAQQYLDTNNWQNAEIDPWEGFRWSPVGSRLLFWVKGRFGEVQPDDNPDTLHQAVIYDASTGVFRIADQPYDLNGPSESTWAPDGRAFVFVDRHDNLVHVDTSTGISTVVDNNVRDIVIWRSEACQ